MYKRYKNYIKVICGALLLATGYGNAMAPTCINSLIAFLSGGQVRLGSNSPVQFLDQETARRICKLAAEKDVVIISEDETSLSVRLQQPEIPFERQVILGRSSMCPRRRVGNPVLRDMQGVARRLFQGHPYSAVVEQFRATQSAIDLQEVQQLPSRMTLTVPFGNFQVTVSNIAGDLRKVCRIAVLEQIESLRVSQRSIVPVDINGQRLQAIPLSLAS